MEYIPSILVKSENGLKTNTIDLSAGNLKRFIKTILKLTATEVGQIKKEGKMYRRTKPPKKGDIPKKEQKAYLLEKIEIAIKAAPDTWPPAFSKNDIINAGEDGRPTIKELLEGEKDIRGTITIKVPGSIEFKILNNKIALQNFRKKAKSFPTSELGKLETPKLPSTKPLNKRITGFEGEYKMPYKPRKAPNLIERPKNEEIAGWFDNGFYTTGAFAVKMPKPKTKRPLGELEGANMRQFLDRDIDTLAPAIIGNETYTNPDGENSVLVTTVSGTSIKYDYNPLLMDFIFSKYPNAEVRLDQEVGTLFYHEGSNLVGTQMQYMNSKRPVEE